ncbi:hypothetical protein PR048_013962 [Dryococelus australis]|uniref:Uncharacterized protein n=1 Tax=Dryococelus australis TaxID=614101 RepID=A0ABQ9HTN3_9NEOP|nr:hypothetical protein PR048_013962 [Dryococelus australis]
MFLLYILILLRTVSDDTTHDSAHALYGLEIITREISKFCQLELLSSLMGLLEISKLGFNYMNYVKIINQGGGGCIFSANGHGKSACDAIDGFCKHFATKFHLRRECVDAIRDSASFVAEVANLVPKTTLLVLKGRTIQTFRIGGWDRSLVYLKRYKTLQCRLCISMVCYKGFQWQEESGQKKDEYSVQLGNVLLTVRNPTPLGPSAILHTFDKAELLKIQHI